MLGKNSLKNFANMLKMIYSWTDNNKPTELLKIIPFSGVLNKTMFSSGWLFFVYKLYDKEIVKTQETILDSIETQPDKSIPFNQNTLNNTPSRWKANIWIELIFFLLI